jgi:hypothetical protein
MSRDLEGVEGKSFSLVGAAIANAPPGCGEIPATPPSKRVQMHFTARPAPPVEPNYKYTAPGVLLPRRLLGASAASSLSDFPTLRVKIAHLPKHPMT